VVSRIAAVPRHLVHEAVPDPASRQHADERAEGVHGQWLANGTREHAEERREDRLEDPDREDARDNEGAEAPQQAPGDR
jgi:hypothetical protein